MAGGLLPRLTTREWEVPVDDEARSPLSPQRGNRAPPARKKEVSLRRFHPGAKLLGLPQHCPHMSLSSGAHGRFVTPLSPAPYLHVA